MDRKLAKKAKALADRPYAEEISEDVTVNGRPVLLIVTPELPGCVAQGETVEEARSNLREAREDYIADLLEDGLGVPGPLPRMDRSAQHNQMRDR